VINVCLCVGYGAEPQSLGDFFVSKCHVTCSSIALQFFVSQQFFSRSKYLGADPPSQLYASPMPKVY